jgi:hypothetical protein
MRRQKGVKARISVGGNVEGSRLIAGHTVETKKEPQPAQQEELPPQADSLAEDELSALDLGISVKGDVASSDLIAAKYVAVDPTARGAGEAASEQVEATQIELRPPPRPSPATEYLAGEGERSPATGHPAGKEGRSPAAEHLAGGREPLTTSPGASLLALYERMAVADDPRRRGYVLQDLLNELLKVSGIPVVKSFIRNDGAEQIDGAFTFEGWHYLVECRWRERLADIRQLDGLKGQVDRSGKQTLGIFLSINGWSDNVIPMLKQNPEKSILLMNGFDLRAVLSGQISIRSLLQAKLASLNLEAEPYLSADEAIRRDLS